MRSALISLVLLTAACGAATPTDTTSPPPPPSTPLGTAPNQTVGSTGGSVVVSLPNTPIDGMSIAVPSGAFPGNQTIGISYAANTGFAHPAGTTLISPRITIRTSDGALASRPMLVTIPVAVPSGSFPQVVLRNPTNGRQRALPTVAYTATSVTAMTGHFNGTKLMGSDGRFTASAGGAGLRDPAATGELAVVALPLDLLSQDHDTQFRPGVDDWEFSANETVIADEIGEGMVATAAWYFIAQKAQRGPLWKKFQKADGVEPSNRDGMRWVSMAESEIYAGLTDDIRSVLTTLVASGQGTAGTVKQRLAVASFHAVRAALTTSPGEPQMLQLFTPTDEDATVLVYRSTGQQLFAVDPYNPGTPVVIDFSSGFMAPVTLGGGTAVYTTMVAPGYSIIENDGELPGQFDDVQAGTIGDDDFPTYRPMIAWGTASNERTELKGGIAYTFDTDAPVIWMDCLSCIGDARIVGILPGPEKVSLMEVYTQKGTAPWVGPSGTYGVVSALATPGELKVGVNLATHRQLGESKFYWMDWFGYTVRRLAASVAPTSGERAAGADIPMTFSITGAPGNLEYVWDFADGPLVTTTTLTTTHQWATAGTYVVKATARDKTTKQPVARASVTMVITAGLQAWKFTSMSVAFTSTQPQLSGYDSRWNVDSQIVARIANRITEGGFRIVDQAFTPTGFPPRTAPAGLYLLEGASLTLANLLSPATENSFSVATFPNATLPIPAAPQVSGWNLVDRAAPGNVLCNLNGDSYTMNGTVTQGSLVGLRVPLCVQSLILPTVNGQRLMSMDVDVTFGATAATGTISVIYYFYGNGSPAQAFQRVARLTFAATRIT